MKKRKKVIIAIIMIAIIGVTIWRIEEAEIDISLNKNNTGIEEENTKDIYKFCYEGRIINLGEKYDNEKLGEEAKCYELNNNIVNKIYTFKKFEITTYLKDGEDKIVSIYLLDESLETEEGIKIGDTFEELKEKYGEDFYHMDSTYTYKKEKTSINFIVINNCIVSIEYKYLIDEK